MHCYANKANQDLKIKVCLLCHYCRLKQTEVSYSYGKIRFLILKKVLDCLNVDVVILQEVALQDVRKEISFCKKVKMPIIGVVENMSGFVCPHCKVHQVVFLPLCQFCTLYRAWWHSV